MGFDLSKAQVSAYAKDVGVLLAIANLATQLEQDSYKNQAQIVKAEGQMSQGYADAISNTLSQEATSMQTQAIGEIVQGGVQIGATIASAGVERYRKSGLTELEAASKSADEMGEAFDQANKTGVKPKLQNVNPEELSPEQLAAKQLQEKQAVEEQKQLVQGANPRKPMPAGFTEALTVVKGQPDSTFEDAQDRVGRERVRARKDLQFYEESTRSLVNRYDGIGNAVGGALRAGSNLIAAQQKTAQAQLKQKETQDQYGYDTYRRAFDQSSQNTGNLTNAKEMVFRVMAGVAESNKA